MLSGISDNLPICALCEYNISRCNVKKSIYQRKTRIQLFHFPIYFLKTDDVTQAYDSFLDVSMDIFNKHSPVKKIPKML